MRPIHPFTHCPNFWDHRRLLGKAVNYALSNWPVLVRYLENGHITPDNNAAENAFKAICRGPEELAVQWPSQGCRCQRGYLQPD